MENKSDPRIKKVQRAGLEESENGPLFGGPHIPTDSLSTKTYLEVEIHEGVQHLILPEVTCNYKAINSLKNHSNLKGLLNHDSEKKLLKNTMSFWKQLDRSTSIFTNEDKGLNPVFQRKGIIDQLHCELYSWHSLLRNMVNMPNLPNFNVCQVLCHEKGTTNVVSYDLGEEASLKESKTSIESFNKVFNQIKKSKGKQFSQTQLSIPEFNFVGSFLASTHQLKTHNILFLLSENSFFPIGDKIVDEVDRITPQIKSVLEKIINKDLTDSKISNLFHLFELLPLPVSIHNPLGLAVYQNNAFKSNQNQEGIEGGTYFEEELDGGFKLVMVINTELSKSDVQHFQRVSLLGELLNTLQHELSNPLFGIQLATDFLNLQPNEESVKESLSEISEYCKRCQDILRDFKFIYQGGDQFLNVSLKKLIKETLTLTKSVSRGIKKEIIFDENIQSDEINTNPTWLSQIIFNLIINSSQALSNEKDDYSTGGNIKILVRKTDSGSLEIRIEDNGPGIEESKAASIFDPFYTTKEKGTGLGLAICQSLSKKLGGRMSYSKTTGGGAAFSLLLPFNEIHI